MTTAFTARKVSLHGCTIAVTLWFCAVDGELVLEVHWKLSCIFHLNVREVPVFVFVFGLSSIAFNDS